MKKQNAHFSSQAKTSEVSQTVSLLLVISIFAIIFIAAFNVV